MQLESVRKQLLELSSRSDDDAIIGKMQQELINIKVSYQKFSRKYEGLFINLRRKELQCRQLHEDVDQKETMLLALQQQMRKQVVSLQQALERSERIQQTGSSVERTEGLLTAMQKLTEANERQEEDVRQADEAKRTAEADAAAKQLLLDEANREIDDLQQLVKARNAVSDDERAMHMRLVAKRMVVLSEQVKAAKLERLRIARQLQVSEERQALLRKQFRREEEVCASQDA